MLLCSNYCIVNRTYEEQLKKLEVKLSEARLELGKVKDKLQPEIDASKLLQASLYVIRVYVTSLSCSFKLLSVLQEELECTQQECAVLQDQLQLQRETAAHSLNRIQQASYRKQKKLLHIIKDLRKEIKEVSGLKAVIFVCI